ncbi:MAG TPA: chromate transporter, partial [Anaerovoracaceae bacterium]|nr:chromate transporter [Anaerovoracaceae bacterium]
SLNAVLCGIRPATVGLIASAVIFLAENSIFNGPVLSILHIENTMDYINVLPCLIFIGTIILAGKFKVGPIKLTLLAGIIGALVIR